MRIIVLAIFTGLLLPGTSIAATIAGPSLDETVFGHLNSGIDFKALTNSTITSFVFVNQGNADVIVLEPANGGAPLYSLSTPAGEPSYLANVSWNLHAGQSYWLLQTIGVPTQNNGFFATLHTTQFPVKDADISVAGGVISNSFFNIYWADFNNITTAPTPVPEPSTFALAALGALGIGVFARGKRWRRAKSTGS